MGDGLRNTVVGPALESRSPPLPLQAAHRGQGGRRERPGHQRISEAPPTGTRNVRLSSPEVSVREGPRQLTHNCRLELIVVILCSAYLHLHKGTRNASSGFGEMTGPQNLGPQEPSVRILLPLPPSHSTLGRAGEFYMGGFSFPHHRHPHRFPVVDEETREWSQSGVPEPARMSQDRSPTPDSTGTPPCTQNRNTRGIPTETEFAHQFPSSSRERMGRMSNSFCNEPFKTFGHICLSVSSLILCVCVCMCVNHFSHVQLSETPWTIARQPPLSMRFSRQEHWSG